MKKAKGTFFRKLAKKHVYEDISVVSSILFFLLIFIQFLFPENTFLKFGEILFGVWFLFQLIVEFFKIQKKISFYQWCFFLLDVFVILSIAYRFFLEPSPFIYLVSSFRILRAYHVFSNLSKKGYVSLNRDIIFSAMNLLVFIFVMSAVVFIFQGGKEGGITDSIDAFYFTIATLTTTGFGDIIVVGSDGKILASVIMIFGAALFLHLAASIFRPHKVPFSCRYCGLTRHEADASHCKHCGHVVRIQTKGE